MLSDTNSTRSTIGMTLTFRILTTQIYAQRCHDIAVLLERMASFFTSLAHLKKLHLYS